MLTRMGGDKGKNPPVTAAVFFAGMVALTSVKSTVQVTDVYSGSTVNVANIPLLIAVPASIFTTGSYKLFQSAETAYSSTNGSYQGVSTSGYVMPLKLLFSLRKGVEKSNPYLSATLQQFIIDCIPGSSVNMSTFRDSADFVDYLLTNSRPSGLTTFYTDAATQGTAMACPDAVTSIQNTIDAYMASAQLKRLINENARERNPTNASGFDIDDVEAAYTNNIASAFNSSAVTVPGAVQGAGQFMKNALFYATVTDTFKCMDSAGSQSDYNLCNITLNQGMEPWKADATAQGSMFAKMALPAMIFLQLMFFGFAPLVILYSFFLGAGSVGLYVKFLGFGVWTMSWLPFSAVIQMYIQNNVTDKLAALQTKAVTAGNYEAFMYDVLSTRLALASDLLAATPMVTLALLSGSIYGMSSLAGRWSGRDYMDEKNVAPPHVKTDAEVAIGSGVTAAMRDGGQMFSTQVAGLNKGLSISTGQVYSTALSNAQAEVKTTTETATNEFGKTLSSAISAGTSGKDIYQFAQSTGLVNTAAARQGRTDALNYAQEKGFTAEQAEQLARKAEVLYNGTASASLGVNLGGLAKINLGGQTGLAGSSGELAQLTDKMSTALKHLHTKGASYSFDNSEVRAIATTASNGQAIEKLQSSTFGEANSQSWKNAVSDANAAQTRFESLRSRSSNLQLSATTTSEDLINAIKDNNRNDITRKASDGVAALKKELGEERFDNIWRQTQASVHAATFERGLPQSEREHARNMHALYIASNMYPDSKANDKFLDVLEAANPITMGTGRPGSLKGPDMTMAEKAPGIRQEVDQRAADGREKALAAKPIVDKVKVDNPHSGVPRAADNPAVSAGAFEQRVQRLEKDHQSAVGNVNGEYSGAVKNFREDNPQLDVKGTRPADVRRENDKNIAIKADPEFESGVTDPLGLSPLPMPSATDAPAAGQTSPQGSSTEPVMPRPMGGDASVKEAVANALVPDNQQFAQPIATNLSQGGAVRQSQSARGPATHQQAPMQPQPSASASGHNVNTSGTSETRNGEPTRNVRPPPRN
jgi:hypothetical protein